MTRIAILLASAEALLLADGTSRPCGFWAEEVVGPWRRFTEHGAEVVVTTPDGAPAPVEKASLVPETASLSPEECSRLSDFLDRHARELGAPRRADELDVSTVDGLYVPGGYAPLAQLHTHPAVKTLLGAALDGGRPIATVCHGTAALLSLHEPGHRWPFAGQALTGFSDAEEDTVGMAGKLAWTLQAALTGAGGEYRSGPPWAEHVLEHPKLITGQNPASADQVALALIEQLG
ncbi:type 1 glutamine amidotransferase domain-containing protein [Amycolatopsis sp. PS_44_ISF1]|uniref:type 1 glutamine amidotransferase domain-containing protein n=1 Tax=Amycolatopsis sp. PS_44_ISF1 TaxID=2974917 RepID=UPI0028E05B4A|nr:type 1 glutamine amidotransferase domain-containing protein [Amycolatopsis sp. PS_44_ISF1]MDT8912384.1 type 1 glutamine amidotransferase domain-containing protein [Amycolatopsis sp. PS_44_ISF1]